jgi:hypothetical protein
MVPIYSIFKIAGLVLAYGLFSLQASYYKRPFDRVVHVHFRRYFSPGTFDKIIDEWKDLQEEVR